MRRKRALRCGTYTVAVVLWQLCCGSCALGYGEYKHVYVNVKVNVTVECGPECVNASVSVLLRL